MMDDLHPAAVSSSITLLDISNCRVTTAFLAALPELRSLDARRSINSDTQTVDVVCSAFSSLQQLTSVSLYGLCAASPASLTHLTSLRRLRVRIWGSNVLGWELPPPGGWSSDLQQLHVDCSIAFRSLDALRHMPALQHLQLVCSKAECTESVAAWGGLLDAAGATRQLQRLYIVKTSPVFGVKLNMSDAVWSMLLRLQRTHPHLTLTCEDGHWMCNWDA